MRDYEELMRRSSEEFRAKVAADAPRRVLENAKRFTNECYLLQTHNNRIYGPLKEVSW